MLKAQSSKEIPPCPPFPPEADPPSAEVKGGWGGLYIIFLSAFTFHLSPFVFASEPVLQQAQDDREAQDERVDSPAQLGEIEVTATYEQHSSPTSFTTVIKPAEQAVSSKRTVEILSNTVGLQTKDLGGPGQYSTVSIRGSTAEQVAIFLDGVRLNTPQGGGVDFSSIPVEIIDKIEVIRGGGTNVFGPDAMGGAINIITKRPKKGSVVEASATFGSFTTIKLNESWQERRDNFGLVLSHTHSQSAGDYSFKSASTNLAGASTGGGRTFTRINNGFVAEDLLTKFDIEPIDNLKFQISNNFYFTNREVPGLEEETTLLAPTNPVEADELIFRNASSGVARLEGIADDHLAIEVGVTNNFLRDHYKDPSPAIGTAIDRKSINNGLGPYIKFEPSFPNDIISNNIALRYDYRYDYFHDSSPSAGVIGRKTRNQHGIFLQDIVGIKGDIVTLSPSVRYEDASDFSDDVSLRTGAQLKLWGFFKIKGNIETSYRYPNFSELYFPDQGYIRGNSDLRKEEALNIDGGFSIEHKFADLEFSYFRNDIKNSIIFVPISATTIAPINTFDVDSYGVEATGHVRPVNFLTIETNYTWLNAHFASNKLQLPGRPRHKVNTLVRVHHAWWELFGETQYVSSLPINVENTVFIASRTTVGLGAKARFLKRWFASFEAKDITNVQVYDARGFPLPRRSFFGTLGVRWGSV